MSKSIGIRFPTKVLIPPWTMIKSYENCFHHHNCRYQFSRLLHHIILLILPLTTLLLITFELSLGVLKKVITWVIEKLNEMLNSFDFKFLQNRVENEGLAGVENLQFWYRFWI